MAKKAPKKYSNKALTNHLYELAAQMHDVVVEDDGTRARTKGQALAEEVFKRAIGWTERRIDDEGTEKVVQHKPEPWAIQLIWERCEGKSPQAVTEDTTRITAKEKVSELVAQRLNRLIPASGGPPEPPSLEKKGAK